MRKIKEEIGWKEERFTLLDKVDQNRMADAEMEAELQGLQAGEESADRRWLFGGFVAATRRPGSKWNR